jgi:hypothetical protein
MLQINRKELPLSSVLTTFEVKIKDEKMNKDILKIINKQGDRQNYKTNVKAQMTEWHMLKEPGFDKLSKIILELAFEASKLKYNRKITPVIVNMWGMKYKSEEIAVTHDHWPFLWSCAYYINPPEGAPGLFFPEANAERKLENGLLVMFEGHIKHSVRPSKYKGYRYVVSANVNAMID